MVKSTQAGERYYRGKKEELQVKELKQKKPAGSPEKLIGVTEVLKLRGLHFGNALTYVIASSGKNRETWRKTRCIKCGVCKF